MPLNSSNQTQPPWRIIFFGTAQLACPSLAALAQNPACQVAGVVTQPDRPKGRDLKLQPPPVKEEAIRLSLPVLQPERARDPAFVKSLAELRPALIVVAAYGQILPPSILDLPTHGCVNVHASLLPKYRGAAPIQWAILNDAPETGVTIMKMDPGLDTGDILSQSATPIQPADNAQTLHDRLAQMGADLLLNTIPDYISGRLLPRKQPHEGSSYARKITKEDGRLNWEEHARPLWNRIRALTPWPGTFTSLDLDEATRLIKIWEAVMEEHPEPCPGRIIRADKQGIVAGCGADALRILSLQLEGGKRMTSQQFLAGHGIKPGERFR
jgi:methionyl-tRNA formyltransferase